MSFVKLFRYVRPNDVNIQRLELEDKPTGGVAVYFEIDQEQNFLYWSSVICRDDENFSYKLSQNISKGRAKKEYIACEYRRDLSLIDNILFYLDNKLNKKIYLTTYERTLRSKLKSILKNNSRNKEFLESIKQNIKNNIDLYK